MDNCELVAALLVMRARDVQAMLTSQRWVRVSNFMEKLVAYSELQLCQIFWHKGEAELQFQDVFRESPVWINHVLKVRKIRFNKC
jgi:hypothetical protein